MTKDHLGSGSLMMGDGGTVLASLSSGSFGERRGPAWHDEPTPTEWGMIEFTTRRGFTWHEHLDSVNLIHMNGRVYDPWLGQFLSADPVDGNVYLSQRLARYSYVMNSPHTYTDPTGFDDSCIGKSGGNNRDCHREMDEIIVTASRTAGQTAAWDGNNVTVTAHQNSSWPQDEVQAFLERMVAQGGAAVGVLLNLDWTLSTMYAKGTGVNLEAPLNHDAPTYIDLIVLGKGAGVSVDTPIRRFTFGDRNPTGPVRVVAGVDARFHRFIGGRVSIVHVAPSTVHVTLSVGVGFSQGFNFYSVGHEVGE